MVYLFRRILLTACIVPYVIGDTMGCEQNNASAEQMFLRNRNTSILLAFPIVTRYHRVDVATQALPLETTTCNCIYAMCHSWWVDTPSPVREGPYRPMDYRFHQCNKNCIRKNVTTTDIPNFRGRKAKRSWNYTRSRLIQLY